MRVCPNNKQAKSGNVLTIALLVVCVSGFFLYSYLYLSRSQRNMVARSQSWNAALAMAEAGVEEALAQLNPGVAAPSIDRSANGWGSPSGGLYGPVSRTVSSGTYSVVYDTAAFPTIYATGYVSVPSIPANLKRTVCVTTTNRSLFGAALVAKLNIDLKGNGIATDSFDSTDYNLSSFGRYDPSRTSTNGDVASIGGLVNVANADITGKVLLGPTASNTVGSNGSVSGGVDNDFNVELQDVVVPQVPWFPQSQSPTNINSVTYDYAFMQGGDYSVSGLKGNIYVAPGASVRLLLPDDASPTGVNIDGMGTNAGTLTIYMDGANFNMSGGQTMNSGIATNFTYFGTTNNTSISLGGNSGFTGTIYAPEADFHMGGGGSTVNDFVGAIVVESIQINGHFRFHFDEALLLGRYRTGFIATSWREI